MRDEGQCGSTETPGHIRLRNTLVADTIAANMNDSDQSYEALESLSREKGTMVLEVNEQPRHGRLHVSKGLHGT